MMLGITVYTFSENARRARMFIFVIISVIVRNAGFYIMRDMNTYLSRSSELFAISNFNKKYLFMAPVHFAFRETVGIFQRIMDVVPLRTDFGHGRLLVSDFLTILPGKQVAGGFLIKNLIIGVDDVGGLTPSALGGLYFDFGYPGLFLGFAAMGVIAGYFYKKYMADRGVPSLVNLVFIYTALMHYMHRGVLAPHYFFLFIVLNAVCSIGRSGKGG
jgi:hypothetical protein